MAIKIKLTTGAVDKLRAKAGEANCIFWDTQESGFGLRVGKSGKKTYFYKGRPKGGGKERTISLGRHGDPVLANGKARSWPFGADDARAELATVRALMLKGIDPVRQKQDDANAKIAKALDDKVKAMTLREVVEDYLVNGSELRPSTEIDYRTFMERYFADWLDEPVATITRDMCLARLGDFKEQSTAKASKAMRYLRMYLSHAARMSEDTDGEPRILARNPINAMSKQQRKRFKPPKGDDGRIPLGKVGAAWYLLRTRSQIGRSRSTQTAADWLSTMLLTGMRKTESGALRWTYLDFETKTIHVPGEIKPAKGSLFAGTKNHNDLHLPMSETLHDILKARHDDPERDAVYVFPSTGKCPHICAAPKGTLRLLKQVVGEGIKPHDFRRTLEDIAKTMRVDSDERRQLLNHLASDIHGQSYSNNPDPEILRPAVNAIAEYIVGAGAITAAQVSGANVVNITERKDRLAGKTTSLPSIANQR